MDTDNQKVMVLRFNQAFQSLLLTFSDLYKYPDEQLYTELKSGQIDKAVEEHCLALKIPMNPRFKEQVTTYEALTDSYNDCFLGVRKPFAPPVESVYKVWTSDQSYQVPHKNQKGYLMGDSALHIKHILQVLDLEIPQEYEMTPDHITILLELLAYLTEKGLKEEAIQFQKDHLDWLPDFYEKFKETSNSELYAYTTLMLIEILKYSQSKIIN